MWRALWLFHCCWIVLSHSSKFSVNFLSLLLMVGSLVVLFFYRTAACVSFRTIWFNFRFFPFFSHPVTICTLHAYAYLCVSVWLTLGIWEFLCKNAVMKWFFCVSTQTNKHTRSCTRTTMMNCFHFFFKSILYTIWCVDGWSNGRVFFSSSVFIDGDGNTTGRTNILLMKNSCAIAADRLISFCARIYRICFFYLYSKFFNFQLINY